MRRSSEELCALGLYVETTRREADMASHAATVAADLFEQGRGCFDVMADAASAERIAWEEHDAAVEAYDRALRGAQKGRAA